MPEVAVHQLCVKGSTHGVIWGRIIRSTFAASTAFSHLQPHLPPTTYKRIYDPLKAFGAPSIYPDTPILPFTYPARFSGRLGLEMSPQRYEAVRLEATPWQWSNLLTMIHQINAHDDENESPLTPTHNDPIPSSPPPSFRSRASSPTSRRLLSQDPLANEADQNLADTFDDGEMSENEDHGDDRQRLMRADTTSLHQAEQDNATSAGTAPRIERRVTELPIFTPPTARTHARSVNRPTNDGVFANLAAKPERGEQVDEKPPTYEQAAADATPPYWETTIVAPGMTGDEVYVDGLPVGSVFSFIWNGMISMSFQLVGFLLTYLLHTTHAAKNGSRAGLGLTLVQYGFYMRGSGAGKDDPGNPGQFTNAPPPNPNSHNFDPNAVGDTAAAAAGAVAAGSESSGGGGLSSIASSDWISYVLMIVGWFILIRAVSDFLRARRHEQLVLQSPTRGLTVPIVAESESTETTV